MASQPMWSNQQIGAIARRIRTNDPATINVDAFVRIARQMRDEYEVDRTRLNNELADTLTALAAALTKRRSEMTVKVWTPVAKSLEYDLITHATKGYDLSREYRICVEVDAPPTVAIPEEVQMAIVDLISGIRNYNAYAYAKEINAVIDWLEGVQGEEGGDA